MNILTLVAAGVASWLGTLFTRRYAWHLRLVQAPNHRSSHSTLTPHGGGIGILLGSTFGGILLSWPQPSHHWLLLGLALILGFVGLGDDIWHLPAKIRFAIQFILCTTLLAVLGITPASTPATIQSISSGIFLVLTLLAGVWWINLYNFMDGIDGIAGTQAIYMLVSACAISAINYSAPQTSQTWAWMLVVAAATAGFLIVNWPPAKIFMGDVGSTFLAFMIYGLALVSINEGWATYSMWIILGCLFIVDATTTLITRVLTRQRWHEAHRSHAYQRLSRRLRSHRQVTLLFLAINIFWLAPLAALSNWYTQYTFFITILAYTPIVLGTLALRAGRQDNA